jgi:hypothetical protein
VGCYVPLKAQCTIAAPFLLNSFNTSSPLSLKNPIKERNNIHLVISPLKHEAFFCKMEDKVYSKLNIWVTLRAGNDDIYRKLIATP